MADNGLIVSSKEKELVRAGATREVAYKKMVEALDAESMTVDKFGDEHMTPDHGVRLRAAELISKLNGDLKEVVVDNRTYNTLIQASTEEIKAFSDMVEDVQRQLANLRVNGKQTGDIIDGEIV